MDQAALNSKIKRCFKKKESSKSWSSFYSEIIITDHVENSTLAKANKTTWLISKTKGRFFIQYKSESFSPEEFKFRFENKELTFSSLKKAIESIIEEVSDGTNNNEFEDFLNQILEHKAQPLSENDACVLILQFYTTFGKLEDKLRLTRRLNNAFQDQENLKEDFADLVLLKFLHLALIKLPFYSGQCVRAIELDKDEQEIYKKGSIINWKNFNSSSKGDQPVAPFDKRNTYFYLSSLTGRDISKFSCFPDEREVLFPPGCNFLVRNKKVEGGKTHIYMEQIGVVFTENIVLWVDGSQDCQFLAKLYGQTSKYKLWVVQKSNANEAIKYIEENLTGHLSQCKSFQIVVKPQILQEDIDNGFMAFVNKNLNRGEEKIYPCYCYDSEGNSGVLNKDYVTVNSEKNLMEDLQAKFKYKGQFLDKVDGLNNDLDDYEDYNLDANIGSNTQSGQEISTQLTPEKFAKSGDLNSWKANEQSSHCNSENTSQLPNLLKFERAGGSIM